MGCAKSSKRPQNLAKLKSKLSSETLMKRGFVVIFFNIIFGLLPVTLHKSYISHCWLSTSKIYTTYLIFAMSIASYYFLPAAFNGFVLQNGASLADLIAVSIMRTSHVLGYVLLLIRAHWVAKQLPGAWKLLIRAVQHGILEIHGKNWAKLKKLRCFTIYSIVIYVCLVFSAEMLFTNSKVFECITLFVSRDILSDQTRSNEAVGWIMWGFLLWDIASLSHVLVSILLNFLVLTVVLCLKSVNQLLRKVVAEYVSKDVHTEAEDRLLLYRLNHVKKVYSICEDFIKNLNVTFGITIVVEVLVLMGNTLINLYFMISQFMLGDASKQMYDFSQFIVSVIAHFYFLYKLACACSLMETESKHPLRILKDLKYNESCRNVNTNNQVIHFLADMGNSSIVLSAADYFQVNKYLITSLVAALTTYLIVLIQFKFQERGNET